MFYYPTVLKRHSGCFSTIWLVATKGIKIPRRDFLKVNVIRTCDDIMSYVLQRVPPPQPGLPRPRFSLYLSSQLQYGVILVYHRQCALLLQELQSVLVKLLKQRSSQIIDMDEPSRQALDFPDALSLMEDTEGALDPLFGVMFMREAMPSPNTLIQMGREYQREWSPELPAAAEQNSAITAFPETITLREREPIAIPPAEFEGMELVDQHPDTIDILMAQTGHFPEGEDFDILEQGMQPGDQEMDIERDLREEDLEGKTTRDFTASTIDSLHPTLSTEDVILPQEDPGLSGEKPTSPSHLHTPTSVPILPSPPHAAEKRQRPSLQLKDVPTPEVQMRTRKRQLIFFDPETQIPEQVQQEQINDPHIETGPRLTLQPPSQRLPSAAELFNNPCTPLPEELLLLWKQAATITPLSGSDLQVGERGPESNDSEKEREHAMVEAAEEVEAREGKDGGAALSPYSEFRRDVVDLEMNGFSDPDTTLERSDQREMSRIRDMSPMFSPEKEGPTVPRSLKDIPEVVDELLERAAAESPGLPFDIPENEEGHVVFASLLPPDANRRTVSKSFMRLLESLTAKSVRAEQDEPYGDILIFPGLNYEEQRQTL
ncbi:LOW QUALITY PROTEIN: meiotic recombination protein REC8 homolog [Gymnodraco acuticeps]|uniref:LOW QUALITY PROTEIN: meiotic recombination protein REC8 homolog n=1 Tax=Gymnodraco acuticeps TaxID=8218 RepID=A0A6P8TIV6_GYMAC|nr:LOW QUALITY PROTEIN: meiotic recombination protein REC8 homolog [Gymnodraco acuticeps]